MRNVPKSFYQSKQWQTTRTLYLKTVNGLCEDCLAKGIYTPAEHIHHLKHLNSNNINDPRIAYGFDNLRAVCIECHNKRHAQPKQERYTFDEHGNVVYIPPDGD